MTSCGLERIGYLRNLPLDKLRGTSLSNSNYPPQNCQLAPENGWLGDDPFILGPLGSFRPIFRECKFFPVLFPPDCTHFTPAPQQESLPFRDDPVNWKNGLIIGLSISSLGQSNKSWIQFGDTGGWQRHFQIQELHHFNQLKDHSNHWTNHLHDFHLLTFH